MSSETFKGIDTSLIAVVSKLVVAVPRIQQRAKLQQPQ